MIWLQILNKHTENLNIDKINITLNNIFQVNYILFILKTNSSTPAHIRRWHLVHFILINCSTYTI